MKKHITLADKQIQEQINALEEENRNTKRLSMGRGYGWGDNAIERRENKILCLNTILMARRLQRKIKKPKIPKGMTLQKSLTKSGGQMHFKNSDSKKKSKALNTKKTRRKTKKGSDKLLAFGIRMPDVKTLDSMAK